MWNTLIEGYGRARSAIGQWLVGRQARSVLLSIAALSLTDTFLRNGIRKFDPTGFWSHSFLETWGYPLWFMYFIGVLEVCGGLLLLLPRFRPVGSGILAVVMLGAFGTKSVFGAINGIASENAYGFLSDTVFFFSTIALLLFFIAYELERKRSG